MKNNLDKYKMPKKDYDLVSSFWYVDNAQYIKALRSLKNWKVNSWLSNLQDYFDADLRSCGIWGRIFLLETSSIGILSS